MDRLIDIAKQHGITTQTLRVWEKKGLLEFERTPLGRRLVTPEVKVRIEEILREHVARYLPKETNHG